MAFRANEWSRLSRYFCLRTLTQEMGSGSLGQLLLYQYRSTRITTAPSCSNASRRMATSGLAGAKGDLLATILRLFDVSAAQPLEHRFANPPLVASPATVR